MIKSSPMSARLQRASRHTLTSGSFSGYSLIIDTSLGITPLWTNWSCWYAGWEREREREDEDRTQPLHHQHVVLH